MAYFHGWQNKHYKISYISYIIILNKYDVSYSLKRHNKYG